MIVEAKRLIHAGYRCMECGRLDQYTNQPCTDGGDVEEVYRIAEGADEAQE